MRIVSGTIMLVLALQAAGDYRCFAAGRLQDEPRLRRPIGLQLAADEAWLYVANQRSGSLSVIDVNRQRVVGEIDIAARLSALQHAGDGRLLATDETRHELLLLECEGQEICVRQRVPVSPYPVAISVTQDRRRCAVASLWSRRLTLVALPRGPESAARVEGVLDLPFAPRCQLLVQDDKYLIAADSFGGRLAIVDMHAFELLHVREFPAHNIRGLALSANGKMLLIAHQMLNELAHTVRNDVHWGLLMSNDLRWLRLDAVLSPDADLYHEAHMHPLGHAGDATADPSGLVIVGGGRVAVSLGGVGEIAMGAEEDFSLRRLEVGRRPTALVANRDGRRLFVANTFGDSISIVDVDDHSQLAEVSLGTQEELALADRGELLFYDGSLSHDGWMSCNSCHADGHTNGLLNDNFSDSSFGAPKRVLSLLGRADTAPFAWNGDAPLLDAQIRKSINNTMQSEREARDDHVNSLVAYLETLRTPPSIDELRGVANPVAIQRGREVFDAQQCADCHAPPTYTSAGTYDVGLDDKLGNQRFNPPPLRGVGQRSPFFHDGRAQRLEDVFRKFKHQLQSQLSDEELSDLQAFLRSL